jgi:hypothetical protein
MFISKEDTPALTKFLVKHSLKIEQYWFLWYRHNLDNDNLAEYIKGIGGFKREDLKDLVKRGYLDNVNSPGEEMISAYFATPKFYEELFADTDISGEELWEAYPTHFYLSGGSKVVARSCDKDQLIKSYAKKIKHNLKKHKSILEILEVAKQRGDISMGIEKWVASEQWKTLKDMYKEQDSNSHGIDVH